MTGRQPVTKGAQKASEATERKKIAEEQRTKRIQAQKAKSKSVQSKKRSIEESSTDIPWKRVYSATTRRRIARESRSFNTYSDNIINVVQFQQQERPHGLMEEKIGRRGRFHGLGV